MSWYNKNTIPEWKIFIDKPFTIQGLLLNKQVIIKDVAGQKEIQQYLHKHQNEIVQHGLKYCLESPTLSDSYDRKYLYPTKAIQILTNQQFFSHLEWNKNLIHKFIQLLIKFFLSVDSHVENINLYHGYFQRLMKMLTKHLKKFKGQIISAFEEEECKIKFIHQLMKYSHKYAIVNCMLELLLMDLTEENISSLDFKITIINEALYCLENAVEIQSYNQQKVENNLLLLKMFLEQYVKYLLNNKQNNQKTINFLIIYSKIAQKFDRLIWLLKNGEMCLKICVMEFLQINQIFLIRINNLELDYKWCDNFRKQIIQYLMSLKVGILHPFFLEFLIILFSDIGENADKLQLFINPQILEKLLNMLLLNKQNNILSARILELFKVVFINLQKEIILNIQTNKNIDISQINFPLFNYFFQILPHIQKSIKEFKSYNEPLFSHLIKIYKIFHQYSLNIESILQYYHFIEICNISKDKIKSIIQFYKRQDCFKLYEQQLSKQLGSFFVDEVFQKLEKIQYSVVKTVKQIPEYNSMKLSKAIVTDKIQDKIVQSSAQRVENSLIQIKLKNDLLLAKPEQQNQYIKKIEIQPKQKEIDQQKNSYQNFKNIQMKQAEKVLTERKAKSKTPTKGVRIKNQVKKVKNKWAQNQENQEQYNEQSRASNNNGIDKKIRTTTSPRKPIFPKKENSLKIALMKISNRKIPKITTQRQLDFHRDNRLIGWLKLIRQD